MTSARLLALVPLLALACGAPPVDVDGGAEGDASVLEDAAAPPMPTCRPRSESPTCTGACEGFAPACPCGHTPACGSAATGWEVRCSPGGCLCAPWARGALLDCADDGVFDPCPEGMHPICLGPGSGYDLEGNRYDCPGPQTGCP